VITEYELYSDERRQSAPGADYLTLGGLICTDAGRIRLLAGVKQVRDRYGLHGEIRWTKASTRYFEAYRECVDVFFDDPFARYSLRLAFSRRSAIIRFGRRASPPTSPTAGHSSTHRRLRRTRVRGLPSSMTGRRSGSHRTRSSESGYSGLGFRERSRLAPLLGTLFVAHVGVVGDCR
jgi:hypothetical protein